MSSYSDSTECDKCGYDGATERSESSYTVYYCPLCGWQDFTGDAASYHYEESGKYNPTDIEIERAKRYIIYLKISQLSSTVVYDYDLISYRNNESVFIKKLMEIVLDGEAYDY